MTQITAKAAKAARTRQLTAARRSLKLIQDALPDHVAALADGVVPEDGFLASALKYEPMVKPGPMSYSRPHVAGWR